MNRQPYGTPPQWWPPKMSPRWVRLTRGSRRRELAAKQQIAEIDCDNLDVLAREVHRGAGVLITPNHSAHYDSNALYIAGDRIGQPLYFMAAWQVFAMSSPLDRWLLQHGGCFSVDREGNDRQAFKQAVHILQNERHPLVIFPEGDIYHTTDFVTPFREGAAAIGLSAAKRADRPVVVLPCGIKFWYLDDPTPQLLTALEETERRLYLRPAPNQPLPVRVHRLAEAALALKELDYVGRTREGRLRDRVRHLNEVVVSELEQRYKLKSEDGDTVPERVKAIRQTIIRQLETGKSIDSQTPLDADARCQLRQDMEDVFFAMQLFSYRGDYLVDNPSIERISETIDKFEEDILGLNYPRVRGRRRVVIRFGEPIEVRHSENRRDDVAQLTQRMQTAVQSIIDQLNRESNRHGRAG